MADLFRFCTNYNYFQTPVTFNPEGSPRICAVDCGLKINQLRCFLKRGARVDLVPWNFNFLNEEFDGLFVSNGPGDPQVILNKKSFLYLFKC